MATEARRRMGTGPNGTAAPVESAGAAGPTGPSEEGVAQVAVGGRSFESPPTSELTRPQLLALHRLMVTSRVVDEVEMNLRKQGLTYFQMSCAGHEAIQAAAALPGLLSPQKDWFYPYYRDRTLLLGLGVPIRDLFLLSMGKADDPSSGGRQMPNHFGHRRFHIVSQSSPTGTQFLQAVGTAEVGPIVAASAGVAGEVGPGLPEFSRDEIVLVSGGEGSTSEGEFYEGVSAAALRKLPVLFLIEDNEYAISVPVEDQTPGGSISRVFSGCPGLFVQEVDGTDVFASHAAMERAVRHCRSGAGPALVHARVLRMRPHSDSDDDATYRSADEKSECAARDPVARFEERLLAEGHLTEEVRETVWSRQKTLAIEAADKASEAADPTPESAARFVFDPDETCCDAVTVDETPDVDGKPMTMVGAIQRTLEVEMGLDPRIVVFGEDVADCSREANVDAVQGKGGVFKVTQGLQRHFGRHRVFNTPLAEASIVGRAVGMAVRGLHPVIEIQFVDFIWPAMQQIRSELALMRWRSNNAFSCPVVLRAPTGGYVRGGAIYHSQSPESIFCLCPGLRVVVPSNARDAVGLLRTAMRSNDPVLFLEHKHLYRQSYNRAPYPGDRFVIPFGKAATVRPGDDLTVVTYGAQVQKSLEAAERLAAEGRDVEVIDLRTLAPYDWPTIVSSVRRTGRLCVVYEEQEPFGFGNEIAGRAAQDLFEYLDAPIGRLGASAHYVGYHPVLVDAALPSIDSIEALLRRTCEY